MRSRKQKILFCLWAVVGALALVFVGWAVHDMARAYVTHKAGMKVLFTRLDIERLDMTLRLYHEDLGRYPTSLEELGSSEESLWRENITQDAYVGPYTHRPYRYHPESNGFVIIDAGFDQKFGTEDDLTTRGPLAENPLYPSQPAAQSSRLDGGQE